MELVVGRLGRPHGIRGEITCQVRTDDPDTRLAVGSVLCTDPTAIGPLTITGSKVHSGIRILTFDGISDRSAAESLRGVLLTIETADLPDNDPDEFYDHQLIGLAVLDVSGAKLGTVRDVLHPPASPVLEVRTASGDVLVPFVSAIVPEVDLAAGTLTVTPPSGMFD